MFRNPFSSTTIGDANPIRTLGDYSKPSHEGYRNTIELPVGNNVVLLRSNTIQLVQNGCSFHGLRSEDLDQHLKDFLKLMDLLDLDGENRERTHLHLFQFSLRDQASNWFECLLAGSISTWEDLTTRFLAQFFLPGRTAKLRNDIRMFQQRHGESLSKAWTHFKDLLQKVPHHGIDLWLQNDLRDFAKPVKAITLPQDVQITFDRHLIKLENRVQRLMEPYLASTQLTQVNKITASCEICNGPHDTHNYMEGPEKACVDYASSHANEIRGKSYQIRLEKALLDFDSNQEKTLSHLRTQLEQQHDDMIGKINLLWKTVSEKLNDASPPKNAGNSMAPKSITAISHDEKEELRKKGIKSPSILLSLKYLSPASIKELNKNPLSLKRVHFINSIVILSTDNDKEEDEMETDMEVEEVIEEEDSEFKTNDEVKEIFEEEEEDEDDENFNSFPTIKELSHHEWLLKNP
ncbi:MAK10-like protein [Tanacetum coccineum]